MFYYLWNLRNCYSPWGQITTPLVYDESLSYEQQIAHIFGSVKNILGMLDALVSRADFEQFLKDLDAEQEKQLDELNASIDQRLKVLRKELLDLIGEIESGMNIWNVTQGTFSPNVQAMRDLFNDVTVHALTVDSLSTSEYTVDTLANSGLNVRGLAVYSGSLVDGFKPEGIYFKE